MIRLPSSLLVFATTSLALTFTSPFSGSTVDLTSSLQVTWIPDPSDPSTFTLEIINTNPDSSYGPQTLASNIQTSSGSYTLPPNSIDAYGDDFELSASGSDGTTIGNSGAFGLADGVYTLQTASDGVLTIVTSTTQGSALSSTSPDSAPTTTSSNSAGATSGSGSGPASSTTAAARSKTTSTSTSSVRLVTPTSSPSHSTSSSTAFSAAATSSSSSSGSDSGSDSNLGFNSAANVNRISKSWSVIITFCVAFLGAFAVLA